jgi:hypothetical protein
MQFLLDLLSLHITVSVCPIFSIPLSSSDWFGGSICPLKSSQAKFHAPLSSYVDLAHFRMLCLSFAAYAGGLLWGFLG